MSARCPACNQERAEGVACFETTTVLREMQRFRVRYGDEERLRTDPAHCAACGTPLGACHHLGCAREQCPECGGALVACPCSRSPAASTPARPAPRRHGPRPRLTYAPPPARTTSLRQWGVTLAIALLAAIILWTSNWIITEGSKDRPKPTMTHATG